MGFRWVQWMAGEGGSRKCWELAEANSSRKYMGLNGGVMAIYDVGSRE